MGVEASLNVVGAELKDEVVESQQGRTAKWPLEGEASLKCVTNKALGDQISWIRVQVLGLQSRMEDISCDLDSRLQAAESRLEPLTALEGSRRQVASSSLEGARKQPPRVQHSDRPRVRGAACIGT